MRKISFLAILLIAFSTLLNAQKLEDNSIKYSDGVTLFIKRFNNSVTTQYGNGTDNYLYIAKGGRFKTGWLYFTNTTGEDVMIDFKQIFLLDHDNNKYHIHMVIQSGKLTATGEKYEQKLRANKTRLFAAEFWPPYPKGEKMEKIEVNGEIFSIREAE